MFPGDPSGKAAEVVNCRCALLQRAKWGLDEDELQTLKDRAEYFGLDKTDKFQDFEKKYLNMASKNDIIQNTKLPINIQLFAMKSKDFKTVILPPEEYAHVISEINSNITPEQLEKKVVSKPIGDFVYTFECNGFDNYRIIGKRRLD